MHVYIKPMQFMDSMNHSHNIREIFSFSMFLQSIQFVSQNNTEIAQRNNTNGIILLLCITFLTFE